MLQTELGRIETVMAALHRRRPGVAAHCRRVAEYAVRIATQVGLGPGDLESVRLGALLHDVGKMLVPSRILDKPGRPTEREWQELKIHPELGVEIAHRSGFDDQVSTVVLYHHERWDGSGYPDRLSERAIPYLARIVSVADTFDALTSSRDYRERLTPEAARAVIARGAGSHFCPWIAAAFLAMPVDALRREPGLSLGMMACPDGPAVLVPPDTLDGPWLPPPAASSPSLC